jgi:hypothetical protein
MAADNATDTVSLEESLAHTSQPKASPTPQPIVEAKGNGLGLGRGLRLGLGLGVLDALHVQGLRRPDAGRG